VRAMRPLATRAWPPGSHGRAPDQDASWRKRVTEQGLHPLAWPLGSHGRAPDQDASWRKRVTEQGGRLASVLIRVPQVGKGVPVYTKEELFAYRSRVPSKRHPMVCSTPEACHGLLIP
jgi:hypothetical protein